MAYYKERRWGVEREYADGRKRRIKVLGDPALAGIPGSLWLAINGGLGTHGWMMGAG